MSTSYKILDKADNTVELHEHSNVLDLEITRHHRQLSIDDLTPAELVAMALEMLQVASYWMDTKEFDTAVRAKMETSGGKNSYLASYLRMIGDIGNDDPPPALPDDKPMDPREATKSATFAARYGSRYHDDPPKADRSKAQNEVFSRFYGGGSVTGRFPTGPEMQEMNPSRRALNHLIQSQNAHRVMQEHRKALEEAGAVFLDEETVDLTGVDFSKIEDRIMAQMKGEKE